MPSCFNRLSRVTFLLVCLLVCGCQPEAKIETYSVARTSPPRPPLDAEEVLKQLDHILVAIVPQNDKAWFFKLVGKAPAIERQRKAFEDFLVTVKFADSSQQTPSWNLPESWSEKPASAMRAATLVVPDADGDLELAVSSLPLTIEWEDFLVPNVNRWLNQLRRARLSQEAILKLAKTSPTNSGAEATVFQLAGVMAEQPRGGAAGSNPHAGLGIAPPKSTSAPPLSQAATSSEPAANQGLTYETPDGWLPGKMSSMRKAAFLLPGGGTSGEVTVTSFPAGAGQMRNVEANVQRWAGQVGMERPTGEALEKLTEPITVDGVEGTYVELVSPDDATRSVSLFVAMVEREGQVWFFKMIGGSDVVDSQRDVFRQFLSSVKFP